jgi:hypothetical protein
MNLPPGTESMPTVADRCFQDSAKLLTTQVIVLPQRKTCPRANAKNGDGKTAFDYAKDNEKLKGTDALKQLEAASE